ncbi:hypothetical protein DERF_009852, partial [Dermatophagoides farinae]
HRGTLTQHWIHLHHQWKLRGSDSDHQAQQQQVALSLDATAIGHNNTCTHIHKHWTKRLKVMMRRNAGWYLLTRMQVRNRLARSFAHRFDFRSTPPSD